MTPDVAPLHRAMEHLSAGAWADARASFDDALAEDRSPAALFGHAVAAWWLGDTDAALAGWEHAYTTSMEREDLERAVFSAVYLCLGYEMSLGNEAVATAWVDRAAGLVATNDLTPFAGWVSLCRAHLANDHGRPGAAESWAREALDLASGTGDVDLELCATAELGTGGGRRRQVRGGSRTARSCDGARPRRRGARPRCRRPDRMPRGDVVQPRVGSEAGAAMGQGR